MRGPRLRVAVVSHTYVVRANAGKLAALERRPDVELLALSVRRWRNRDIGERLNFADAHGAAPRIAALPVFLPGYGSVFAYGPGPLLSALRRLRPDLVHGEEEPWSIAALQLALAARFMGSALSLFTWENIDRRLPAPLRVIRRFVLRRAIAIVAGNREAATILRRHGFEGTIAVLPQLGVDPAVFVPGPALPEARPFTVGYVGRLVPEKGVHVLLEAVSRLPNDVRLLLIGTGPLAATIRERGRAAGFNRRLELREDIQHAEVPGHLREMSVLVLPSLTTTPWKEQFGHVLIEAMACGVPVVGSDSGAIPDVIGSAGLIVKEGDPAALASVLGVLRASPATRARLAALGRERATSEFSDEIVARRLVDVWRSALRAVE